MICLYGTISQPRLACPFQVMLCSNVEVWLDWEKHMSRAEPKRKITDTAHCAQCQWRTKKKPLREQGPKTGELFPINQRGGASGCAEWGRKKKKPLLAQELLGEESQQHFQMGNPN